MQEKQSRSFERKQSLNSDIQTKDEQSQGSGCGSVLTSFKVSTPATASEPKLADTGLVTAGDQLGREAVEAMQTPKVAAHQSARSVPCEEQTAKADEDKQLLEADGRYTITTVDQPEVTADCDFEVIPAYYGIIELD